MRMILCDAMQRAVETAYKAVMKPKEGTILTVARGAADQALELVETTDDLVYFIGEVIAEAEDVLAPDTGDASGLKAGRRGGLRRPGAGGSLERALMTRFSARRLTTPSRALRQALTFGEDFPGDGAGYQIRLLYRVHHCAEQSAG